MLRKIVASVISMAVASTAGQAEEICFNKASGRHAEFYVWDREKPAEVISRTDDQIQTMRSIGGSLGGSEKVLELFQLGIIPLAVRGTYANIAWKWDKDLPQAKDLSIGYKFDLSAVQTALTPRKPIERRHTLNGEVVGSETITLQKCEYEVVILDIVMTGSGEPYPPKSWQRLWLDPFNLVVFKSERFETEAHWKMHFADTTTKLVRLR
ncbi:MAG: hypothetical protein U1A24_10965 [Cypionkella sp.]|uniref:hypothetical protein n=2 Tax=Cypionkella sp. TaxID=2811411 RepID=UPI002AB89345|nr:hypothetical protein [Cypionkella sp.]MDZ4311061.1 hypothetical protein [Cypionkella sp.]